MTKKADDVQITISDPVLAGAIDSFMVEIQTVMGDADGYRDFTVGPFKRGGQESSLQSVLETLRRMENKVPRGDYDDVLGYMEWFCAVRSIDDLRKYEPALIARDGEEIHQEIMDLSTEHYEEWHMDPIVDGAYPEKLSEYKVFYYDERGIKHVVQIDFEN